MFFLSLLPFTSNIARLDLSLRMMFGQKYAFFQNTNKKAYLIGTEHIKPCNSEYVNDCQAEGDGCQWSRKPNSREKKWQIAISK